MRPRRLAAVAFVLLGGVAFATLEETLVHTDDGCVVETHCNACLLQMGTAGVVAPAFSLPPAAVGGLSAPPALPPRHEDDAPRHVCLRGPPHA
jgi:hypothetical protein